MFVSQWPHTTVDLVPDQEESAMKARGPIDRMTLPCDRPDTTAPNLQWPRHRGLWGLEPFYENSPRRWSPDDPGGFTIPTSVSESDASVVSLRLAIGADRT